MKMSVPTSAYVITIFKSLSVFALNSYVKATANTPEIKWIIDKS